MSDGILIGLWGFVWVRLLCQPGEVFDFVPGWAYGVVQRIAENDGDGRTKAYTTWQDDLAEKAYKALCGCAKCHAGQVAFWSAFVCDRDVFEAFTVFVVAVFIAWFLERLQAKMER